MLHRAASSRGVPRLILKGNLEPLSAGELEEASSSPNTLKDHSFVAPAIVPGNMVAGVEGGLRAPLIRRERGALRPDWKVSYNHGRCQGSAYQRVKQAVLSANCVYFRYVACMRNAHKRRGRLNPGPGGRGMDRRSALEARKRLSRGSDKRGLGKSGNSGANLSTCPLGQ